MVQTPSPNDTFFGLDISSAKKTFTSLRRKISKRYLLLEFGNDSLTYGEARVINDQVKCSKINRINKQQDRKYSRSLRSPLPALNHIAPLATTSIIWL